MGNGVRLWRYCYGGRGEEEEEERRRGGRRLLGLWLGRGGLRGGLCVLGGGLRGWFEVLWGVHCRIGWDRMDWLVWDCCSFLSFCFLFLLLYKMWMADIEANKAHT